MWKYIFKNLFKQTRILAEVIIVSLVIYLMVLCLSVLGIWGIFPFATGWIIVASFVEGLKEYKEEERKKRIKIATSLDCCWRRILIHEYDTDKTYLYNDLKLYQEYLTDFLELTDSKDEEYQRYASRFEELMKKHSESYDIIKFLVK